jgi:hypothetical protein
MTPFLLITHFACPLKSGAVFHKQVSDFAATGNPVNLHSF